MSGLALRLLKGSGALLLAVLAGCGGRTSVLDSDAVNVNANQPAGGSTSKGGTSAGGNGATGGAAGSAGKGGSTGTGTGGASSTGTAGTAGSSASGGASSAGEAGAGGVAGTATGGATGLPPSIINDCTGYCGLVAAGPCPSGISTQDCTSACVNELTNQSLICQTYGDALLNCLTTVFKNSNNCRQVDELSAAKCLPLVVNYQACLPSTDPIPTPPPPPTPPPLPTPPPRPLPTPACAATGSVSSNGSCSLNQKCDNGTYYAVSCYQTSSDQSSCTCNTTLPDGSGSGSSFGLNESTAYACNDSLAACGFPQFGAR